MLKKDMEKLLSEPSIWMLILALVFSVIQINPRLENGGISTDIQEGFDLVGGSRIILQPSGATSPELISETISTVRNRLNVYGLKDVKVREVSSGSDIFIMVEATGLSEDEIRALLAKQGKFEMRIENITFARGEEVNVVPDPQGMAIQPTQTGYRFQIPVMISPEAQRKFADLTKNLTEIPDMSGESYLSSPLVMYIDGENITSLRISSELKGKQISNPVVTGGANTRDEAIERRKQLETYLKTQPIPAKLEITSINYVSPTLGEDFKNQIMTAAVLIFVAVSLTVYLYYRNIDITKLIMTITIFDLIIVLGIASWMKWEMDLPSIAGLIVALGISIDQQIIMTDEVLSGEYAKMTFKDKLKEAADIIKTSFGTSIAAMVPLMFASLGTLRGFAITSLLTEAQAFIITRRAYRKMLELGIAGIRK